jgi:hypothetical protein
MNEDLEAELYAMDFHSMVEKCPVNGCLGAEGHDSFGPENGWHLNHNNLSFRDPDETLKAYLVRFTDGQIYSFWAENYDHAVEQAEDAEPNLNIDRVYVEETSMFAGAPSNE